MYISDDFEASTVIGPAWRAFPFVPVGVRESSCRTSSQSTSRRPVRRSDNEGFFDAFRDFDESVAGGLEDVLVELEEDE